MNDLGKLILANIGASMQNLPARGSFGSRKVSFGETLEKASAKSNIAEVGGAEPAVKADGSQKTQDTEAGAELSDDTKTPEPDNIEEPHKKRPEHKGELPDELAALAGGLYRQIIPSPPAEDAPVDSAAEATQVVSILESNTEIEAQLTAGIGESADIGKNLEAADAAATLDVGETVEVGKALDAGETVEIDHKEFEAALAAATDTKAATVTETGEEELTARMPQKTGQVEVPENEQEEIVVKNDVKSDVKADNSSPLENTNNLEVTKSQASQKGAEQNGAGDEADDDADDTKLHGKQPQTIDIAPERFAATESMSKAAAPKTTATQETLMTTIIENIELTNTSESKFMEISLKPEYLGKVAIQLSLSDGGLEIRIKADDNGVKSLLAGQLSQLTSSLESKGVKIVNIDVVQTNVADHTYGQSQERGQSGNRQPHGGSQARTVSVGIGIGFTEEPELVSTVEAGQSSVEYTA